MSLLLLFVVVFTIWVDGNLVNRIFPAVLLLIGVILIIAVFLTGLASLISMLVALGIFG